MKSEKDITEKFVLHKTVFESWQDVIVNETYENDEQLREAEKELDDNYKIMVILGWVLDMDKLR